MEVKRKDEEFQPVELKILIESQEEFDAIRGMSKMNISIPKQMGGSESADYKVVKLLLDKLNDIMVK